MKIFRDRKKKKLWLSQEQYTEKVLERFSMSKLKPVSTSFAGIAPQVRQIKRKCKRYHMLLQEVV